MCGVCDGDGALRRRTEFHCILATEHQVMGLEGALHDLLASFSEVDPRGDAQSF